MNITEYLQKQTAAIAVGLCLSGQLTAMEKGGDAPDSHTGSTQARVEEKDPIQEAEFHFNQAIGGKIFSYEELICAKNWYEKAISNTDPADIHTLVELEFELALCNVTSLNFAGARKNFRTVIEKLKNQSSISDDDAESVKSSEDAIKILDSILKERFDFEVLIHLLGKGAANMLNAMKTPFRHILNHNISERDLHVTPKGKDFEEPFFNVLPQIVSIFFCLCTKDKEKIEDVLKPMADKGFALACITYMTVTSGEDSSYYQRIERAANNGDIIAQYFLGTFEGYTGNRECYLRKCAEQGSARAQYHLGLFYINNNKKTKGITWLKKAAPYYQDAQVALQEMEIDTGPLSKLSFLIPREIKKIGEIMETFIKVLTPFFLNL